MSFKQWFKKYKEEKKLMIELPMKQFTAAHVDGMYAKIKHGRQYELRIDNVSKEEYGIKFVTVLGAQVIGEGGNVLSCPSQGTRIAKIALLRGELEPIVRLFYNDCTNLSILIREVPLSARECWQEFVRSYGWKAKRSGPYIKRGITPWYRKLWCKIKAMVKR